MYALKIMDKKFITKENKTAYVKLERIVLDQLDHPGIVKLFFTFQDNFSLCNLVSFSYRLSTLSAWIINDLGPFAFIDMALESCEGGELFDQITRVRLILFRICEDCFIFSKYCVAFLAERSSIGGWISVLRCRGCGCSWVYTYYGTDT